jgi:hypothetical protein
MVGLNKFRGLSTTILLGILGVDVSTAVEAKIRVEGTVTAVRVTTNEDAALDVLAALGTALNVRYHTSVPLDRPTGGTYAGTFAQVMSRLLDGYSYVIAHHQGAIELIVVGKRGTPFILPPRPDPSTQGIVAQWR